MASSASVPGGGTLKSCVDWEAIILLLEATGENATAEEESIKSDAVRLNFILDGGGFVLMWICDSGTFFLSCVVYSQ